MLASSLKAVGGLRPTLSVDPHACPVHGLRHKAARFVSGRRFVVMAGGSGLLQDKLCFVTGASRGIGAAIAEYYAREGGKLIITAEAGQKEGLEKVAKRIKDKSSQDADVRIADLSKKEEVDKLAQDIMSQYKGGVDVLVNNAASLGPIDYKKGDNMGQGPLDGDPDEWLRTLNINLHAVQRFTRWLCPAMKERGSGWVVNINSSNGLKPSPSTPAYCASKWGVRAWSLSLHDALKEYGIKVTTIYPPATSTNMTWDRPDLDADYGMEVQVEDVAEAALLPFKMTGNALPLEIILQIGKDIKK